LISAGAIVALAFAWRSAMTPQPASRRLRSTLLALAGSAFVLAATTAPALPTPGSSNVVTADPVIPAPPTTPCVVPLFDHLTFIGFDDQGFDFTPPAACAGPWVKVVFSADFDVSAGRQFDRTAQVWLGGANIYFGTTQEPRATVAPSWHVERDLTDYSALFADAHSGHVTLGNVVNDTYTGIIHGSASLLFYPAPDVLPDHLRRPDTLIPLAATPDGGTADLASSDARLSATLTLPTNIERAFLDVIAQSQAGDEFWYTCVPDDQTDALQSCGGTAFRESEISIDGTPAGVAPIYPWIYTGGIDPYLWRPSPGIQTLSFQPYRVDLTPFAGTLSDGRPHTVAVGVFNAQDHFSTTANLLLYLDHGSIQVTGDVLTNTLTAPDPVIATANEESPPGNIHTTVKVTAGHDFEVSGFVETSHGRIETKIQQAITFSNDQGFNIDATGNYSQFIAQNSGVDSTTTISGAPYTRVLHEVTSYVLQPVAYSFTVLADGSQQQTSHIAQELHRSIDVGLEGYTSRQATLDQYASGDDTLHFDSDGNLTGQDGQFDHNRYVYQGGFGACYERSTIADGGALTSVTDGESCPDEVNSLSWFDAFSNTASSLMGYTVQILP
jgi:hypothetical protein